MKQVLIYFTNQDQLVDSLDMLDAPEFDTFYRYSYGNCEIVLVYDRLTTSQFEEQVWPALNQLQDSTAYYIYHTYPVAEIKALLDQTSAVKGSVEDLHEMVGDNISQYYIQLDKLLEAGALTSELFAELWEQFDKDSKVEDFLDDIHKKRIAALGNKEASENLRKLRDDFIDKL